MNPNDMAFPVQDCALTPNDSIQLGLTKREYFASAVHAALEGNIGANTRSAQDLAEMAVQRADALILALSR